MPAAPTPAVESGRNHLFWIDWLRFLAAATVLLDHVCDANWLGLGPVADPRTETWLKLLVSPIHLGREAVIVFFVLSGALVGGLTLARVRAGAFDAASYATDRFARIYVPLIPALLLTAASVRMLDEPVIPLQLLGCVFALQEVVTHHPYANGPLWSLSYEVWFYVLAGCLAALAGWRQRTLTARLVAAAVGTLALGILCLRLDWTYFACWLLGAAAMPLSVQLGKLARPWTATAGLLLMFVGVAGFRPDFLALAPSLQALSAWAGLGKLANLTLGAGTLFFIAAICRRAPTSPAGAWFERAGTTLAAFSYTLYLTHMPVLRIFASTTTQLPGIVTVYSLARAAGWFALSLLAALVMYGLFEKRTPQVRRWLRARFPTGVPPQGETAAAEQRLAPSH